MKVALVYDRINKWGGAERVLLTLHKIFPDAPLFTSVYNSKNASWAQGFKIKTSFLQNFPFAKSSHELYALFMPLAFESFNFKDFDLVISVTSESAKGIITGPNTKHICYLLTPTRYLWSGYNDYFRNPILKFISIPAISYLRFWDKIASNRPDKYIVLSDEVKKRAKKYYGQDAEIIYPSVESIKAQSSKPDEKEDFFLIVSRLVYYKRLDIAINAFNITKQNLKVIGSGGEESNLKRGAGDNIEFLGNLTEEKLSYYYKNCKALIFPGIEDFGLVMAEAQSFGKPIVAFRGGGAMEIVKEGVTGEFFNEQTPESLIKALTSFNSQNYNTSLIIKSSERFSYDNFKKDLLNVINSL